MWVTFDMAIYAYLYVYIGHIYFRCGSIYMGIYMWKYLACNLEPRFLFLHIYLWGWAEMKFLCRYTNSETCSPTSYAYIMREHMYATMYVARSFNFSKFVRTYGTCMHHDKSFITYLHCASPYKFLIWLSNSFLLYHCSHESCTIFGWYRWQHQ